MVDEDLDPLCIIVVKSGTEGGKLIFKYPFFHVKSDFDDEDDMPGLNPYMVRISEDLLNIRVNSEPTNINDGRHFVGFTDEILANMFTVSKQLCDSKFELKVNDVRFVGHPISLEQSKDEEGRWRSNITMFHIVFALKAVSNYSVVQCYHELSHRIGLALKHEEKRVGYLNQQTKCLIAAMDEVITLPEDQQEHLFSLAVDRSNLAKDIQTIYHNLCSTGEIRLYINKWIELSFCLPHKLHKIYLPNSSVEPESIFQCLESLRPYHTLLFLLDKNELLESLSTDASPALRRLIRQSSPLKSLRTLSVDTDLSLMQVFQLTGHLLYWGKVTVIYPICESNIYVLSSTITRPLPKLLQTKFAEMFFGESLLERLASFSLPCRLQVPPPLSLHQTRITEMIIWLLRNCLIVQLHTYVMLALTPDIAWNTRIEEKAEEKEVPFMTDALKNQGTSSLTGSYIDPSITESDAGSDRLGGSVYSDRTLDGLSGKERLENIEELEKEPTKAEGKGKGENAAELEKERERRKEELLREFTPEEREAILAVPASRDIEDLARFLGLSRFFRGKHHLEEIMYYQNMRRSTLLHLVDQFRDLLIKTEHEDPVVHKQNTRTQ